MTLLEKFSPHERSLFFAGLVIKIVLGATLASDYVTQLFAPFLSYFVQSGFENPYAHFLQSGHGDAFPYPAAMLYVMALPQMLTGHTADPTSYFGLFLFRLPLLAADLAIFACLKAWTPEASTRRLIWLYWLSPVLIYISYIHGQLDVIPIAFLFVSMFYLFKGNIVVAGVLAGLSLASKTNVVLIYPFFFLFMIARRSGIKNNVIFLISSLISFLTINSAYITDDSFAQMVFLNAEQSKVFLSYFSLNDMTFYIVPAGWLLLLALGMRTGLQNRDVFIMFTGFAFCVVLLLIPPRHGWYYWVIPFFTFYFAKETRSSLIAFASIQFFYILYFLFTPDSDYMRVLQPLLDYTPEVGATYAYLERLGVDANKASNLLFTFLQCALLLNCFQIYIRGLARYRQHKLTGLPFLIGIGGDSGAGKSTLSDALQDVFTDQHVTLLRGDDQHRWQRGHEKWKEFTHLNPKANKLHNEVDTLRKLSLGHRIYRQHYDHNTGRFTSEMAIAPKRLILLEGLHPFFLEEQRNLFDLKVFVDPDPQLAVHWKICRDKSKRNYTAEQVLQQIENRRNDSEKYIAAQSKYADIILRCLPKEPIRNVGDPDEVIEIDYEIQMPNSLQAEQAVDLIESIGGVSVEHNYTSVDSQTIRISGHVSEADLKDLHRYFDQRFQEIGVAESAWPTSLFGVIVFLLVYSIYETIEHDRY